MADKRKKQEKKRQKKPLSLADFGPWLGRWWEWVSVLLVFITLEIAVLSLEQARWIKPQPSLTLVLVLAVLTGLLLAKRRLPGALKWCLVIIIGAGVTIWQTSTLLPISETSSRIDQLMVALQSLWQAISMAQPSEGTTHFAIFLIFVTWMLGYVSTWFILRRQNAWVVVALGAIAILINLSNLPAKYYGFFFFYLVAAMLLVGQTRLVKHRYQSTKDASNYPDWGVAYFMVSVFCIGILATSITWFTPEIRASGLEAAISTKIPGIKNVEEYLTNFFAEVPRRQPLLAADEQGEFSFTDVCESNEDDVHFIVTSEGSHYWRTRMYDVYTSSGWTNSSTTEHIPGQEAVGAEGDSSAGRREITYSVEVHLRTDIVLTAGEFVSSDAPVSLQVLTPLSSNTTREQTSMGRIVAVVTPYTLEPEQRYKVTASTISATPAELAEAGDDYPSWVTDYYLQLPATLPARVRQLSEEVTGNATTPYEKILAVSDYISRFPYNRQTEPPPEEADGVDDFLFVQQSGTCSNFASAVAVMLRAAGVPARFCVGYLPGEWDADTENYVIRTRNRHAWAEVYFPGYGWVEFEATPRTGIVRGIVGVEAVSEYDMWDIWSIRGWEESSIWDMWSRRGWEEESGGIPSGSRVTGTTSVKTDSPAWIWPIILLGLSAAVIILVLIFTLRSAVSRRIWRFEGTDYASEIYARMCDLAALAKLGPRPQQTPLEYCAQLTSELPQQAKSINTIVQAYLERRFGRREEAELSLKWELVKARRDVYDALRERLPHRRW
jgi:hypothetical protein